MKRFMSAIAICALCLLSACGAKEQAPDVNAATQEFVAAQEGEVAVSAVNYYTGEHLYYADGINPQELLGDGTFVEVIATVDGAEKNLYYFIDAEGNRADIDTSEIYDDDYNLVENPKLCVYAGDEEITELSALSEDEVSALN